MRWILLDLALALAALAVLAVLVLGLWRKVKALSATVREAGERVERATDALTTAQLGAVPAPGEHPAAADVDRPDRDRRAASGAPGTWGAGSGAPGARGSAGRGR